MPIFGAKSRAARGCASKLACGRRIVPAEPTDFTKVYGKFATFLGLMCTGKRQTHIRNAPSSRTAVSGIGPYTDGACLVLLHKNRSFRHAESPDWLKSGLFIIFGAPVI